MALDPQQLVTLATHIDAIDAGHPVPRDLVMVHALDGFVDAGAAGRQAREHLLATGNPQLVASFDIDQLFDYRARRPMMVFARDHWESYDDPELTLNLLADDDGAPYLLLSGPEPDMQWERFVAAVMSLVDQLGVRLTVGLNSIPMGVPHTRPAGVTAHASRAELLDGYRPWIDSVAVPASVGHLLEYRLASSGHDSAGFAVHVPQYLSQAEYPLASAELIEALSRMTGLALPTAALREGAELARAQIDAQVAEAPEVASVVQALEEQYDAFVAGRERTLLADPETTLPTADELGAEFEKFLAEQSGRDD